MWLTSLPHVGPTDEMLTSLAVAPAYFASARATFSVGLIGSVLAVIVTFWPDTFTVALRSSVVRSARSTPDFETVTPFFAVNVNAPPPPFAVANCTTFSLT